MSKGTAMNCWQPYAGRIPLIVQAGCFTADDRVIECVTEAERGNQAIIIPEISIGQGYWTACKALERSCYLGDDTIEAPRFVEGHLFEAIGGFDEELFAGEDWDLFIDPELLDDARDAR